MDTRHTELLGFRAAVLEEMAAEPPLHELVELRTELRRIEDAVRTVNIRKFDLDGKIKRPVGKRAVKCPTCGHHLPGDTILSGALVAQLSQGAGRFCP